MNNIQHLDIEIHTLEGSIFRCYSHDKDRLLKLIASMGLTIDIIKYNINNEVDYNKEPKLVSERNKF